MLIGIQQCAHMHALHKAFDSNWACLGAQLLLWSMRMMPPCAAARRVPHSKRLNLKRQVCFSICGEFTCSAHKYVSLIYVVILYKYCLFPRSLFFHVSPHVFFLSFRTKSSLNSPAPNLETTHTHTHKSWKHQKRGKKKHRRHVCTV